MTLKWEYTEGTSTPAAVDSTSSPTTVYLTRNVQEKQREGETYYAYETAKLTFAEYAEYIAEQRLDDVETVIAEIIGGDEV